jgi:phage terminase small subunit
MSSSLTPREARFVAAYVRLRNAKQAALAAGYSPHWPQMIGARVLHKPHIVAALRDAGVEIVPGPRPPGQIRCEAPRSRLRKGLTPRQLRFVEAYLVCGNATEAARRIGLSETNAQGNGFRLARVPAVAAAIKAEQEASAQRTRITADRVREELARIAFAEIGDIADWDGEDFVLRPREAIARDDRAAIAELRLKQGKHGVRATIKLHSKQRALDALAKHLGLYSKQTSAAEAAQYHVQGRDARTVLLERLRRIAKSEETGR